MRTLTSVDTALLTSPSATRRVFLKVEITRTSAHSWGGESWVDLTELLGYDWVIGARINQNIDTPADSASISLAVQIGTSPLTSLCPFISASVVNIGGVLIQPYRKVRISTATVPLGTPRSSATFNVVFVGRIDKWKMTRNTITIECRSRLQELLDTWIEDLRQYGDDDPSTATAADIEEVIQNIIDDNYNTNSTVAGTASAPRSSPLASRTTDGAPWQLYSDNGTSTTPFNKSSGAAVRLDQFPRTTIWDAIQRLAGTPGWRLSYRFHEGSGIDDFVLVLEDPDRTASVAALTFDPLKGQANILSSELNIINIRNRCEVSYVLFGRARFGVTVSNSASEDKYGRRYFSFTESDGSQIDTQTEAIAKANGALNDLKEPGLAVTAELPYSWFLQLNDYVAIGADNYYFDAEQKGAITSIEHSIGSDAPPTTTIAIQGQPKAGIMNHIRLARGDPFIPKDNDPRKSGQAARGRISNGRFTDRRNI